MALELNIPRSISLKVWDRAGIELTTPGSAVRHISAIRHFNDCAVCPSMLPDILTTVLCVRVCESDWRSRGRKYDSCLVPYFWEIDCEIFSTGILFPLLIQEGLLSVIRKSICTKYWLTTLSQACPGKKCGYNVVN